MSFTEEGNSPYYRRNMRILILLAVGVVLAGGVLLALKSASKLAAFGSPDCPSTSASSTASPNLKGAEAVTKSATPSTTPMATAGPSGRRRYSWWRHHRRPPAPSASPTPSASKPAPSASNPAPSASNPQPSASNPQPSASNPAPSASNPAPSASNPAPSASNPAPSASPSASSASPSCAPTGGTQAANPNCTLIVPPNPLSAKGLASPYQLVATDPAQGACHEANADQSAFVQAAIINNGKLWVYNPLVVDEGAQPAAKPVTPNLPTGATVAVWFGYNGDDLTLKAADSGSLTQGRCVGSLNGSDFGQYAYCNAPAFFRVANRAINAGKLAVPAIGTAKDGMPCPTTRDFSLVDQDQSDNVQTHYLLTADGRTAQETTANKQQLPGAQTLENPSDNGLLDAFVDPALGCTPWTITDMADRTQKLPALALDELQADAHQAEPSALVPLNNPMTTVNNGQQSAQKTNLYRAGVDQPPLPSGQRPKEYCQDMDSIQSARLQKDQAMLTAFTSPAPDQADSLFTFMASRLQQSFVNLACDNFGLTNPVSNVQTNSAGVVTGVTFAK